jgi:hypothetical protein
LKDNFKKKGIYMTNLLTEQTIYKKIFVIRGHRVMIDRDLAELYSVETRVLNQAVRRNIERFPADFMFSLTREEIMNLSQIVISSKIKHAPNVFAFTENGVAMLSTVLNSKKAIEVNIRIMRAFTGLRKMLSEYADLRKRIDEMEQKYDSQFRSVFTAIRQLLQPPQKPKKQIGFITGKK